MDLKVLPDQDVPAYRQIADQIKSQILRGTLPPGEALPPIRLVSKELGISVITVRSAWEILESEGLIETRAGSGCYVSRFPADALNKRRKEEFAVKLRRLIVEAKSSGLSPTEMEELIRTIWHEC